MKKYFALSLMLALTIITAACNDNKPVIDSSNVAVPADTQKRYSADKIGSIIAETAAAKGWKVNKSGAGLISAQVLNRKTGELEVAIVIHYSHSSYGITPDKTAQSDPRVYDRYTGMLRREIDKRLSMAAYN